MNDVAGTDGTADAWDAHAADYARLYAPLTGHVARAMVRLVEARLPPEPRPLDIACGPGDLALTAAELCAERGGGSVLATDLSPAMVALTERLIDPRPRASFASITTAEGLIGEVTASAPVSDAEIHVVDATLVLPSPKAAWRGMVGNPVTGALIARCTPDERDAVERGVLANFERRAGGPDRSCLARPATC